MFFAVLTCPVGAMFKEHCSQVKVGSCDCSTRCFMPVSASQLVQCDGAKCLVVTVCIA